jgi:hypothetical protein
MERVKVLDQADRLGETPVVDGPREVVRTPLRNVDTETVGAAARMETRNREVFLPPVSAYRWWARRTEAINGAVLDALAIDQPGRLLVVDPFAGGGVIPLAAAIRKHWTYAQDLNPWAATGLAGMLDLPNARDLAIARDRLAVLLSDVLRDAYATTFSDGSHAQVSHTFRVATAKCLECGNKQRLFPHAMVSLVARRERGGSAAYLACPAGHLFRGTDTGGPQPCPTCQRATDPAAVYTDRRIKTCIRCGAVARLEELATRGKWSWEVMLVERTSGRNRELAIPTAAERKQAIGKHWTPSLDLGTIPAGQETRVLLRHGFKTWADLYPARQRFVMEQILAKVDDAASDIPTRRALRLAVYGVAEMAGHLSRWDRFYLKSYEAMAGHRFNFTTFAAEPNVWGTSASGRGSVTRRIYSFLKAADWMHDRGIGRLEVEGPLSSTDDPMPMNGHDVRVVEGDSRHIVLPDHSTDIVLTDPPYHDDVQYGELSLPLRAWAGLATDDLFGEASVNQATQQNTAIDEYRTLLTGIFADCNRVLRPGGHLIFSYANRDPSAWAAVIGALEDADFQAVGYTVLSSENETDVVKRNVRACVFDFMIDVVPKKTTASIELWAPSVLPPSSEGAFLAIVGEAFLHIGHLGPSELDSMMEELGRSEFLSDESGERARTRGDARTAVPPTGEEADKAE